MIHILITIYKKILLTNISHFIPLNNTYPIFSLDHHDIKYSPTLLFINFYQYIYWIN